MIYELLLIQEGGMFIPSDTFARRTYKRTDSTPHECNYCGLVYLSEHGCEEHIKNNHNPRASPKSQHPLNCLLPVVSVSLLQTCRIIRFEASPIFYTKNQFNFADPATMSNFRWSTDCAQAGAIQEIGIKFGSSRGGLFAKWATYVTKRTLSLGQDFPHLKRMTINLDTWVGVESAAFLRSMSEGFRERTKALDWVLVLMLNDEKVLDALAPLVEGEEGSGDGKKELRRHVWTSGNNCYCSRWKNAVLWWGYPGDSVPTEHGALEQLPCAKSIGIVDRPIFRTFHISSNAAVPSQFVRR